MLSLALVLVCVAWRSNAERASPAHPNVLLIATDDFRPQLPMYGFPAIHAPNLEALAQKSLVFKKAYCNQAVCSPSRNSFMTGRRPDHTRIWNFKGSFRTKGIDSTDRPGSNWTSLPQAFKHAGYLTSGGGKLFHPGSPPNNDEPYSWSPEYNYYQPDAQIKECATNDAHPSVCALPEDKCTDKWISDFAIQRLTQLSNDSKRTGKPFFFGAGFHKPHPDWALPQEYLDMYLNHSLPLRRNAPNDAPPPAFYGCDYLSSHSDVSGSGEYITPNSPLSDQLTRKIRSAYFGGITFTDKQIGRVLDTLSALGHSEDTIVVFLADHGWALGELNMWCKQANYELQTHVPLIVHVPWLQQSHGRSTDALVELVDVFPTLSALAKIQTTFPDMLDGNSLVPILNSPDSIPSNWKTAVFQQYPRCLNSTLMFEPPFYATKDACTGIPENEFTTMGYAMRTSEYRYVEWREWPGHLPTGAHEWGRLEGVELYAHSAAEGDIMETETNNVAYLMKNQKTVNHFAGILKQCFLTPADCPARK